MNKRKTQGKTFELGTELLTALNNYKKERKVNLSAIVRDLLRNHLEEQGIEVNTI